MVSLTKLDWNGMTARARESLTCDDDLLSYLSSQKEGMIHLLYGLHIWLFCVIGRETRVMSKCILKEVLYQVRCLKSNEDVILALAGQFKQLSHTPEKYR